MTALRRRTARPSVGEGIAVWHSTFGPATTCRSASVMAALRALQVVRHVDALEARHSNALHSASLRATMATLSSQLAVITSDLAPNHIKGLKHRADAVVAAVDLQVRRLLLSQ